MNQTSKFVDLAFPLTGSSVPLDHGYPLFGALSRHLPWLRDKKDWAVHPIAGRRDGPGVLALTPASHVKLRQPVEDVAAALVLMGCSLEVDGHRVSLGAPRVWPLVPAASLRSRFVTIKGFEEEETFRDAVRRQIASVPELEQDPERIDLAIGPRRVAQIKGAKIVGFAVVLGGLDANASIALQRIGLGGRRHMGAGVLVPPPRRIVND